MSLLASTLVPPRTTPLTSFGNEPFYITAGKALFVFVLLVLLTLITIWAERRVVARMQQRVGPNRAGPGGVLQGLADGIKLALKEDIIPALADRPVYILAPVISAIPAFLAFSVIPFGPTVSINGNEFPLQLTDLPVGVLFVLAMSSIGVYGIILAGWSSGSVYPLLGSMRSAAQVISYEVALGLSLVAVFLYAGSLSTSEIVAAQDGRWFVLVVPVSFVIYAISAVGETNRAPFDLPEAESELVGGFHTEYSSLKFAMFFLAEYINMITVIAVAVTLFFGGWKPIYPFSQFEFFSTGYFPIVTFVSKVVVGIFFFIWLRGTLPRLRYDQFMDLGWKVLVPVSLVWIVLIATVRTLDTQVTDARTLYIYVGGAIAVGLVALAFWPQKKEEPETAPDPDAHALGDLVTGGYPVPSLPLVHSNPATGPGRALGLTPPQPPAAADAGTGPEETTSV